MRLQKERKRESAGGLFIQGSIMDSAERKRDIRKNGSEELVTHISVIYHKRWSGVVYTRGCDGRETGLLSLRLLLDESFFLRRPSAGSACRMITKQSCSEAANFPGDYLYPETKPFYPFNWRFFLISLTSLTRVHSLRCRLSSSLRLVQPLIFHFPRTCLEPVCLDRVLSFLTCFPLRITAPVSLLIQIKRQALLTFNS